MRTHLTRMVFVGALGMVLASAALVMPQVSWADGTKADASTPESPVPNATYDARQPGADDPRVKEGFAAYKTEDFKKAYDIWLPLAEAGNAEAQFRMGRLYSFGEGVEQNDKIAVLWYIRSSSQSHIFGSTNLGAKFDSGEGVPLDQLKAFELYKFSANQCDNVAQFNLGTLYARAELPYRSYKLAYKWLLIAETNGHRRASKGIRALQTYSTSKDYDDGFKQMQEWLTSHSCK